MVYYKASFMLSNYLFRGTNNQWDSRAGIDNPQGLYWRRISIHLELLLIYPEWLRNITSVSTFHLIDGNNTITIFFLRAETFPMRYSLLHRCYNTYPQYLYLRPISRHLGLLLIYLVWIRNIPSILSIDDMDAKSILSKYLFRETNNQWDTCWSIVVQVTSGINCGGSRLINCVMKI